MMIRERLGAHTSTVLLIRVSWDPVRKRSAQKVLGSFRSYVDNLPDDLAGPQSPLTEAEKDDARAWIAAKVARRQVSALPGLGRMIVSQATMLSEALEDPDQAEAALSGLDHLALYGALDRLGKALRKHQRTRPPRRKASGQTNTDSMEAFGETESLTSA